MEGKRAAFQHEGRTVYEWAQNLDTVSIFVKPPPGVVAKMIECSIKANHLTLGLKGNPPFVDEDFWDTVVADESTWTLDDGELEITLQKAKKALVWDAALKGHQQLTALDKEEAKKAITLERFQEENPGFDFSGAEFSGAAPDPREFMDGVKYT
ncbi:NudC domain-containing protein 2 [Durusdinium trenchii]|uniref:NudC domain-containing protein 2 n=1 Tax=Durusdinium trenchii TaxID=1381693 RepID=A0ABP0J448_9DINO